MVNAKTEKGEKRNKKNATKARKKKVNLNSVVRQYNALRKCSHTNIDGTVSILFDNIQGELIKEIEAKDTRYVSCTAPYLSNGPVLKALSSKGGVRIISNAGPHLKSTVRKRQIMALKRWSNDGGGSVVRVLGRGRGRNRTLVHTKVFIGYNVHRSPIWITTGSWNATGNAGNNIENMVIHRDRVFLDAFNSEFECLWNASEHWA